MHHCMLHASENPPIYDGTDTYVMSQENDYYVYHNVATVAIPTRCPTIAPENASSTTKGA